jgi:hypothetical protein
MKAIAEALGGKAYSPTSKIAGNLLKNNLRWVGEQIKKGRHIFDIGRDIARKTSEFYAEEVNALTKAGLERVHRGSITVKKTTYDIYEWIKK